MLKKLVSGIKRIGLLGNCAIVITAGLIQDAGGLITDFSFQYWFPDAAYSRCINAHFRETARRPTDTYLILLTVPAGDTDFDHFTRLERNLTDLYGEEINDPIQVEAIRCQALREIGGRASEATETARDRARTLLERAQADVVLWGTRLSETQTRIRFARLYDEHIDDYDSDGVTLNTELGEYLGKLISAKAIVRSQVTIAEESTFLVPRMRRSLRITGPLVANMPSGLNTKNRAEILSAHGDANLFLGRQSGSQFNLDEAIVYYNKALKELENTEHQHAWANIQDKLGVALSNLGDKSPNNTQLKAAINAHLAALDVWSRDSFRHFYWGRAQNNLGTALFRLGGREQSAASLEAAIIAFEAAISVHAHEISSLSWANYQNNLVSALLALGVREQSDARLEKALTILRTNQNAFSRDAFPLYWASAQNNLGRTLMVLGIRRQNENMLVEAARVFEFVLEVFSRENAPLQWAIVKTNLGLALSSLGEMEARKFSSAVYSLFGWQVPNARLDVANAQVKAALNAYEDALQMYDRLGDQVGWAHVTLLRGITLTQIGQRETDNTQLLAAADTINEALSVFSTSDTPGHWARAQGALSEVFKLLGEREKGTAYLEDALRATDAALAIRTRDKGPFEWAITQKQVALLHESFFHKTGDSFHLALGLTAVEDALEVLAETEKENEHAREAILLRDDLRAALEIATTE